MRKILFAILGCLLVWVAARPQNLDSDILPCYGRAA
jgi:hypothetical protein